MDEEEWCLSVSAHFKTSAWMCVLASVRGRLELIGTTESGLNLWHA